MKKRILSILLAVMMVVSVFVMPTSIAAEEVAETIYSWDGFEPNDIRIAYADKGQVVDLGFRGPVPTEPVLDGKIDAGYSNSSTLSFMDNTEKYVEAKYAVYGDYLYVAIDQRNAELGDKASTERRKVQLDIGVAGSASAESTWNRICITVQTDGTINTLTSNFFTHEVGANAYSSSMNQVRCADYLKGQAFENGIHEFKFDLGQLYRLFSNLPGGQKGWETPCVNFAMWITDAREGVSDHYAIPVSPNFSNANGRSGDWVSNTVIIPEETLANLRSTYKGVIGKEGYDYRNAIAGQLAHVNSYATTTPEVDGVIDKENALDNYTTTGTWNTKTKDNKDFSFDYYFSVKDGYLYGAYVSTVKVSAVINLGVFAAVNSTNMRDSRCQTTIKADGTWKADQGGMWKIAQGPTTASKVKNGTTVDGVTTGAEYTSDNWTNKELNLNDKTAVSAWEKVVYAYDEVAQKSTIEFQISIPELLAVLEYEGYNPEEANAVHLMFWPEQESGDSLRFNITTTVRDQIRQTNGYGYSTTTVLPTVELPKGCAERYHVSDVDDMGEFGQVVLEAKQSVAKIDGVIGSSEYTASHHVNPEDYVSYNSSEAGKPVKNSFDVVNQTDYYSYDKDYFYFGTQVYDPAYKEGTSMLQMNIAVLNKHDPYTVTNTYPTVTSDKKDPPTYTQGSKTVKTIRENYIDIANVITRAKWDNKLYNDSVGTDMAGKPGCVIRSQTLTDGTLAKDVEADFKSRAKTFADAGYEFDGSYNADTKIYTFEAKIPLAELKNLFQLGEYDIDSVMCYTLYKTTNTSGIADYAMTSGLHSYDIGWQALQTLTRASMAAVKINYNQNSLPNVINFVDAPLTKDSASARISTTAAGLRFKSVYSNDYLAYMAEYAKAKGETMEVGTIIAPKNYVDQATEFTHEALKALGENQYVDVMADVNNAFENVNGVTTIAGSLVNIKPSNLDRDFAGRGFIKIGNEYFYTDTYTVRNIKDVATAALADPSANYTDGQRVILGKLNGTVQ